ncbi:hypothetical protein D3C81_1286950 [compost metagenome]
MFTLYNSLPLPLFLLVSIGSGLCLIYYYSRNFLKHTALSAIGMIILGTVGLLIGLLKIITEFQLSIAENRVKGAIVFLLPIAVLFIIIGSLIYNKGNRKRLKMLIYCSIIIFVFFIYILLLLIFY